VIDFLLGQHREVEQLFGEVRDGRGDTRRHAFEHLVQLLAVHETAEEEVVYPALRTSGEDGDRIADARTAEEDEAKTMLSDLERTDLGGAEFDDKLRRFEQLVLSHARNEEQEVFPRLRQTQTPERLQQLGTAVRAAEAVAPTHPHPHGPESAVGNVVVGPFVALVDRARDAIRGATR
jgi:hemerythrin superfamily protein